MSSNSPALYIDLPTTPGRTSRHLVIQTVPGFCQDHPDWPRAATKALPHGNSLLDQEILDRLGLEIGELAREQARIADLVRLNVHYVVAFCRPPDDKGLEPNAVMIARLPLGDSWAKYDTIGPNGSFTGPPLKSSRGRVKSTSPEEIHIGEGETVLSGYFLIRQKT